jgi:peptidyl-prolyl cis-trans isomerase SurA
MAVVQAQYPTFDALKNWIMKRIYLSFLAICFAFVAFAQPATTKKVIADKIIGQVGDKIILYSDILNTMSDIARQGGTMPPNPECMIMDGELSKKLLVIQAEHDSLLVSEEELDAMLDNRIRYYIQQYGGQAVLEEVAGKSVYQIKEDLRLPSKEGKLSEMMRGKIVEGIKITPTEVKTYWEKIPKDSLPFYESELEIAQITIYPKANRDIESYVAKELNEVRRQIESGQRKFETMAKLKSEDPGSKDNGGQYNVNRNDRFWDPVFLATSFKLKEGQISGVVKSKFGFHIIQLVSRAGDDAVVRHILMIPPITQDEVNEAKEKLDSVRNLIVTGKIDFGGAVGKYTDEEDAKYNGGVVQSKDGNQFLTIDQLDRDMVAALKDMKPGEVSKAYTFTNERGKKGVRIIYLRSRTTPHRENLKEDYNKIAQRALEQKKFKAMEKWFIQHVGAYYLKIDPQFADCEVMKRWNQAAVANK